MENKSAFKAWILLLILSLIWGSSFILIKRGLEVLHPEEVGTLRIVSAFIVLLPFALSRVKRVKPKDWKFLFYVGMMGSFLPAIFFAIAQTRIASSITGVLNSLTPIFTILIGWIIFNKRQTLRTSIGIGIGFIGTIVLILASEEGISMTNLYALFVVLATVFYGFNLNIIKYHLSGLSALTITSISLLIVGPFALVYLFGFTNFYSHATELDGGFQATFYIILLGVLGTGIALILFNHIVQLTDPIFASSVTYLIPIIAVCWGLLDRENILLQHYVGMVLIIGGVYVANRPQRSNTREST
jgi:drug/metabolite transporter (DMT)-like permease